MHCSHLSFLLIHRLVFKKYSDKQGPVLHREFFSFFGYGGRHVKFLPTNVITYFTFQVNSYKFYNRCQSRIFENTKVL